MKVLAIRGRNIASLDGAFCLDFTAEPLLSAGIFAISGPTGSGKSTLLDAMCLALFARTPRTDQAKENNIRLRDVNDDVLMQGDPRFLLRRGTASGYAEVDFLALNHHRYRARWSVGRARDKENGRLQNARITLYNIDKEEEEQGNRSDLQARIVELIGLTFDQFTRSVLLAQNDFSTFLKAEQGEKASLLEKLTGTEQYSAISRLIFEKNALAREAYDRVATRIQGVDLPTDEEEEAFRLRLFTASAQIARLEKEKAERQTLFDTVRSVEQQIAQKQTQEKEAALKLTRATDLLATARKEYEQAVEQQQQSELRFKALQTELQQARKTDVQLESAVRSVAESADKQKEADRQKKEGEARLQAVLLRQQQTRRERADLHAWRERYRGKEGIAEQLAALLLHLDAAAAARLSIVKAERRKEAVRQSEQQLLRDMRKTEKELEDNRTRHRQVEKEIEAIEEQQKAADMAAIERQTAEVRSERERLLIEQAQFVTTGDVAMLRDKLTDGVPCPVCGSPAHPYATHEANEKLLSLATHIATVTLRIQQLTAESEAYASRQKQLARLQQQQLQLHRSSADGERAFADLQGQQKLFASQTANEETACREQTELLAQSLASANRLFGGDDWQRGWTQDPETFRTTLTDFARRWHENGEKLQQLELQLGSSQAEHDSIASFLPSLAKQAAEADTRHKECSTLLAALQAERAKLLDGKPADRVEQEYNQTFTQLQEQLKRLLTTQTEQSGIAEQSRGVVAQIAIDLSAAAADLLQHREAMDVWTSRFAAAYEGRSLDEMLAHAVQEQTECSFRLRTYAENRQRVAGLQDELTSSRAASERWAKLNDLAGSADGAKFRRIAQGYTLDVLLSYANVQLRGLSRRYRLERVPDTLALQVIDQDMCDEVRTVHSLSGGESFLVSLALALGLSSLSSNRMKVESLFIDEGFGSLDAETLRVAMDALENLHTQGRKIGVISHVQEMTERIPVQVRVNRAGNGRSYLEVL